jgi:inorganic triphosphatase YgiF
MAIETELKLSLAAKDLPALKRHLLHSQLATQPPVSRQLFSIYFDTPTLDLHQRRSALRLLRVGTQWLQTLKGGGGVQAGLHSRHEWEAPVAGEALDFDVLKQSGGELPAEICSQLQAAFVTDFNRDSFLVQFGGAEIELCLDVGEIRANNKTHPICEIELELKSGQPQQLFALALALLEVVPLHLEQTNKAEYGYRLFTQQSPTFHKIQLPQLSKSQTVGDALAQHIWACLSHLQSNVLGAIEQLNDEYLHQIRLALRRLRLVLAMTHEIRADDELVELQQQVKTVCIDFGQLRDWDVFISENLASANLSDLDLEKTLKASEKIRQQQHLLVRQKLQSREFQKLLLRFGNWMLGNYWRRLDHKKLTLKNYAQDVLNHFEQGVQKRGRRSKLNDNSGLHSLRIACKKLRYSVELFNGLLPRKKTERYLARLSDLQDILGQLNDLSNVQKRLSELSPSVDQTIRSQLAAEAANRYTQQQKTFQPAWAKFTQHKTCWH